MQRRSLIGAVLTALLFGSLVGDAGPASAADPVSTSVASRAVEWLRTQQQPDGGFEVSGFPGFETPDAVLALADAAQRDLVYRSEDALAAVRSVTTGGRSALDYLDDFAESGLGAGQAAKVIIAADALGLDPRAFDPQGDGPVDLVAVMDAARQPDGSYGPAGQLNATIEVMRALAVIGRSVGADTVAFLTDHQQGDGGWAYDGDDGTNTDPDVDTTGRAVQALVAAGVAPDAPAMTAALEWLASERDDSGAWSSFGSPDPNATAMGLLAVVAAGYGDETPCYRDRFDPASAGSAFASSAAWLRSQLAGDGHITSPSDGWGVNTFASSQTVQALLRASQPVRRSPPQPCPADRYRVVAANGAWWGFGGRGVTADVPRLNAPVVATASVPAGDGHWLFAADGGVFGFGSAPFVGSAGALTLNQPITAAAATPTGGGYWLFASDGGVFTYGDAPFLGSLGSIRLNQPIVAAASTPTGAGYWLFAADGGVFAFGDAAFHDSLGGRRLNQPVVGGSATRTGAGYWLFASDGGVFAFGDAAYLGSLGSTPLNSPITAGVSTPGDGYWMVGRDGGVFAFGDARFLGAATGRSTSPIVAIAP